MSSVVFTGIAPMRAGHWPSVRAIYEEGIASGNSTFERAAPEWERWDAAHNKACRLVALSGDEVIGWAALAPVSSRTLYSGVAEVSVYVAQRAQKLGVGKELLSALIAASEEQNIWTRNAGIFPENKASIKLHERCGFRVVGTRERVGQMDGVWRDVVLMERRSKVAGV